MKLSPLRQFVLAAALWLPMAFFVWALLGSLVVWPLARGAELALAHLLPDAISAIEQAGSRIEAVTRLQTTVSADGRVGVLVLSSNPMIYAWCLALYAGLVLASPLERRDWLRQLAVGIPVLLATSLWGTVFDVLKLVGFDSGPLGQAAVARAGLAPDAIALGYQFGYLILPAVTPIVLWVVQNRIFLETLVGWRGEPGTAAAGQSQPHGAAIAPDRPETRESP